MFCASSATEAEFKPKTSVQKPRSSQSEDSSQPEPERLFVLESAQKNHEDAVAESAAATEDSGAHLTAADATTDDSSQLDLPSKAIVLKRVWNPLDPQPSAASFFDELEADMRSECAKFGAVEHVRKPSSLFSTGSVVTV